MIDIKSQIIKPALGLEDMRVVASAEGWNLMDVQSLGFFNKRNFRYQRVITITERSGSNWTDYQVPIELDSTNFNFSHTRSDGGDIRFTDTAGNLLPYWIESFDASAQTAKIFVKVPSLPANSSTVIYMYYDNPSASDASDGNMTFKTFDDFEDNEGNTTFSFDFVERTSSDVEAHQAVATDGTYFYTTAGDDNLHLYKWDNEWNLIDSRDCSNDYASDKDQINGIFCKDGKLYVTAFKYYTYSRVLVYNASDLSYETSYDVTYSDPSSASAEGVAFHNGY